jgi:hypothetical protein
MFAIRAAYARRRGREREREKYLDGEVDGVDGALLELVLADVLPVGGQPLQRARGDDRIGPLHLPADAVAPQINQINKSNK